MFEIYADDLLIFDDVSPDVSLKLINPKLTLAINASGSLEFTMPNTNAGYNAIKHRKTTLYVYRDGVEIWRGRAISEKRDFYNSRSYVCEGALSFLNDTANQSSIITGSASTVFESILSNHRTSRAGLPDIVENRKLYSGTISVTGQVQVEPNGAKNYEAINSLVSTYGGIVRTRIVNNQITLDWLADYPAASGDEQSIEFGENLMDFTRNFDSADAVNAVWVRGAKYTQTIQGQEVENYYASGWVQNATSIANYGRVEAFLDMPDLTSNQECNAEAQKYLASSQFEDITLDISALDLHLLNPEIKPFELLDRVHVSSWAHGLDKEFAVIGVVIPLDDPAHETFTLSDPQVAYKRRVKTLVEQTQNQFEENEQEIERTGREAKEYTDKKADEVVDEIEETIGATVDEINVAMNAMSQGCVFIDYDTANGTQAIYIVADSSGGFVQITSTEDIEPGYHVWKWSIDGLGYTNNYQGGNTNWDTAMTYNGWIKGDRIQANTLLVTAIKLFGEMNVYPDAVGLTPAAYFGYGADQFRGSANGIHMYLQDGLGQNFNEVMVTDDEVRITTANRFHIIIDSYGRIYLGDPDGDDVDVRINGDLFVSGTIINGGI